MLTLRNGSVDYWERNAPRASELVGDDPIVRSWHRAAMTGVRPDGHAPPEGVDSQALASLRAELDEVFTTGARILAPLEQELVRRNLVALLTDARGTILMARGGGAFSKTAARTRLVEGACWSERVRGTNAIGTALVERCPVKVIGTAHYERVNHGLFCCAVPIWSGEGEVVAVVDVTGRIEDEDSFAELAATSVAYRLEQALRPPRARRPTAGRPVTPTATAAAASDPFAPILGSDPGTLASKALARRVAGSDLPVLLLAETGTGKELMARAIHRASERKDGPFVAINCGAVAPTLLESELFGFAPGAFTGARASGYAGKIGAANGGTLFLDEVAEMPPPLQAALLRLLDDGAYHAIGDNRARRADVRLICATCRELPAMVRAGTFRSDLYYRIKGATLSLPPLRVRDDRVALAEALLAHLAAERRIACPRLSAAAVELIDGAAWPGNVRELKTALHHALVLAGGAASLDPCHFPADVIRGDPAGGGAPVHGASRSGAERGAVEQALLLATGNLSDAARRLGVARSTLYRLMRRHGLADGDRARPRQGG